MDRAKLENGLFLGYCNQHKQYYIDHEHTNGLIRCPICEEEWLKKAQPSTFEAIYIFRNNEDTGFTIEKKIDLFRKYLGGTGVATQLLHEECPKGCEPFSPENPIILAIGPLSALYPLASKTVAMFKSPLTGDLGESHCGGRSALAIRMAGLGAIVITGKSEIPIYLFFFC